jgi:hypothetical protein
MLVCGGTAADAAQGEFDVTYTAEIVTEGEWLQIGPNQRQRMNVLELTTTERGGFLGASKATCHFAHEEDTRSGAYKNVGWCAWRDGDGNLIFEPWEGSASSATAILFGTGRLTGGTGRFAGITGSLSWRFGEQGRQRGFYQLPSR